ncbi:MAG: hypothetical protein ACT4P1_03365 [Sporichthyaceae bacterium]
MQVGRRVTAGAAFLLVTALLPVQAAPALTAAKSIPRITFTVAEADSTGTVTGSLTQGKGPIRIRLRAVDFDPVLSVFQLREGYSLKDVRRDVDALGRVAEGSTGADVKAARRLQKNVITVGGVTTEAGTEATATLNLAPGKYRIYDGAGEFFDNVRTLTITKTSNKATAPTPAATISMTEQKAFGGATVLPAAGTIRIRNTTTSGHRWYQAQLLHVANGTTEEQVADLFSGESEDDSFVQEGYVGGDSLSPGRSQLLTYSVPPGTYALFCFFPDPDVPGTTYAGNGMVRIVTLS